MTGIEGLRAHWGLTQMPFSKDLAPSELHGHRAHAEAVARIGWCVAEGSIGVLTGECGSGKTVAARAAVHLGRLSPHHRLSGHPWCRPAWDLRGDHLSPVNMSTRNGPTVMA